MMMQTVFAALVAFTAIDGDTVTIEGERIRIANIDTPEIHHAQCDAERRLALVAKRRLESLLAGGRIVITRGDPRDGRTRDRYGRTLATISVGGHDVGDVLVDEGLARAWTGRRAPWCDHLKK
jgi:endonuclease YncB( thermonuclease family)